MKHKKIVNDFQASNLPKTRGQLLIDIIKNEWRNLLYISSFTLIFALPLIIIRYVNLTIFQDLLTTSDGIINNQAILGRYFGYLLLCVPFIWLLSILFSMISRVLKRLSFLQGIFFFSDAFLGLKENIKDHLLILLIYSGLFLLVEFGSFYGQINNNMIVYYLLKLVHFLVLIPILLVFMTLSALYQDTFLKKLKSSLIVYLRFWPQIMLLMLVFYLPLALLLIANAFVQLVVPLLIAFLWITPSLLVHTLLMNHCFDQLINQYHFPSLYKKGLYVEKLEEK